MAKKEAYMREGWQRRTFYKERKWMRKKQMNDNS